MSKRTKLRKTRRYNKPPFLADIVRNQQKVFDEMFFGYELVTYCETCREPVTDRGGWYHCAKCGCAVNVVDADGKIVEVEG